MRILFTAVQVIGHLYPMLPLARAFRDHGDEVAFAGPASIGQILADEDVEVLTAGPEVPELVGELISRTGHDPLAGEITPAVEAEMFAGVRVDQSIGDTLTVARQWRPDVIVGDIYDYLGPLVAVALGVPFGRVTLGADLLPAQTAALRSRSTWQHEALGLRPPPPLFVADVCPPALQTDRWEKPANWLPIRPEAHHAPGSPPLTAITRDTTTRPGVLVTFGTLYADPGITGPLVNDVAVLDVDLRVTLGPTARPEDFDVDHARVRLEPFRPLAELLSDVDLVVCHAGAGTVFGALSAGIPLIVLPRGADQFAVADRVVASGVGVRLFPGEVTPDRLRTSVTSVLAGPRFRASAARVAAQIANMPTPAAVAIAIANLVSGDARSAVSVNKEVKRSTART